MPLLKWLYPQVRVGLIHMTQRFEEKKYFLNGKECVIKKQRCKKQDPKIKTDQTNPEPKCPTQLLNNPTHPLIKKKRKEKKNLYPNF